jgi:hypothetical protein
VGGGGAAAALLLRPRSDKKKPARVALAGIVFVVKTGIPWEYFP